MFTRPSVLHFLHPVNQMRKLVLLGGGALVAIIAAVVLWRPTSAQSQSAVQVARTLTAADSADLRGPRQPIFFRHDLHAGQFQMACQYCHYSASVSSEPGIPSLQTCMGCHLIVGGTDSTDRAELTAQALERAETVFGASLERSLCLAVGDTPHDVAAAHGAGIACVGVASGHFGVAELRDAGADHVLASLAEELPLGSR